MRASSAPSSAQCAASAFSIERPPSRVTSAAGLPLRVPRYWSERLAIGAGHGLQVEVAEIAHAMSSALVASFDLAIAAMKSSDHCCVSSTEWPPHACDTVRSLTTVVG